MQSKLSAWEQIRRCADILPSLLKDQPVIRRDAVLLSSYYAEWVQPWQTRAAAAALQTAEHLSRKAQILQQSTLGHKSPNLIASQRAEEAVMAVEGQQARSSVLLELQ